MNLLGDMDHRVMMSQSKPGPINSGGPELFQGNGDEPRVALFASHRDRNVPSRKWKRVCSQAEFVLSEISRPPFSFTIAGGRAFQEAVEQLCVEWDANTKRVDH